MSLPTICIDKTIYNIYYYKCSANSSFIPKTWITLVRDDVNCRYLKDQENGLFQIDLENSTGHHPSSSTVELELKDLEMMFPKVITPKVLTLIELSVKAIMIGTLK